MDFQPFKMKSRVISSLVNGFQILPTHSMRVINSISEQRRVCCTFYPNEQTDREVYTGHGMNVNFERGPQI